MKMGIAAKKMRNTKTIMGIADINNGK